MSHFYIPNTYETVKQSKHNDMSTYFLFQLVPWLSRSWWIDTLFSWYIITEKEMNHLFAIVQCDDSLIIYARKLNVPLTYHLFIPDITLIAFYNNRNDYRYKKKTFRHKEIFSQDEWNIEKIYESFLNLSACFSVQILKNV